MVVSTREEQQPYELHHAGNCHLVVDLLGLLLDVWAQMIKTVLAPNAPWPKFDPEPEPKPKFEHKSKPIRKIPPKKSRSKIANTDAKFDEWAAKNLKGKK